MFKHYDQTIAAIPEDWFMGADLGPRYVERLKNAFLTRVDKHSLDNALGLGMYAFHTEANKRQRHAVRAVLLATFLLKDQPLALFQHFQKLYSTLPIERLKQEFVKLFPAFVDDTKRFSWAPAFFTNPNAVLNDFKDPKDWRNGSIPYYKFLVHHVTYPSEVLKSPSKLSQWEAISASVLCSTKPIGYSNHGLILSVPENNILTTSPSDQWFDNYAGSAKSKSGQSMTHHIIEKNLRIGAMLTPDQVVHHQGAPTAMNYFCGSAQTKHNEVVICGKPNQKMPYGMTGTIRPIAIFMQINKDGKLPLKYMKSKGSRPEIYIESFRFSEKHNIPLLFIPFDVP